VPQLIAHRGYPRNFPENSIAGIRAALAAGAVAIECDVHLSADHQPVVIHDAALQRTAGIAGDVRDMTHAELARVEVNETARFGPRFSATNIPHLREIVTIARQHPAVTFFLDVKRASLRRFGNDVVLDAILAEIGADTASWVIVSFDRALLERSRVRSAVRVGWAVDSWDDVAKGALHALGPDYVFCAARAVPAAAPLPAGRWLWVVYDVDDPSTALDFGTRGADFVETDAIGEMLASPLLHLHAP
jgi:glycerophosphoryl diester phosphodiesterase